MRSFMPKYSWRPFCVECISGSLARSLFFVELGAATIVASTILHFDSLKPFDSRCLPIALKIASPRT